MTEGTHTMLFKCGACGHELLLKVLDAGEHIEYPMETYCPTCNAVKRVSIDSNFVSASVDIRSGFVGPKKHFKPMEE